MKAGPKFADMGSIIARAMRSWRPSPFRLAHGDLVGRSRYERRLEGESFRSIADGDGVTYCAVQLSVYKYAARAGLPLSFQKATSKALTAAQLAPILGVPERTIHDWSAKGLIVGHAYGKQRRFILEEVKAELARLGWDGGSLYDPTGVRGQVALARRADGPGVRTCSKCRRRLALSAFTPSHGICHACKRPSTRASDIRRRRAKAGTQVVTVDIRKVAERDGWWCAICAKLVTRDTWSLDHIVALSLGGSHTYDNVVLAHRVCNTLRGVGGTGRRLSVQAPLFPQLLIPRRCETDDGS